MTELHTVRPRCRRFPLRLRTLVFLTVLVSLGSSWFASHLVRARRQRDAVTAITELGGRVRCHLDCDVLGNEIPDSQPSVPGWIRSLLGDDFFVSVVFAETPTDEQLTHVPGLARLRRLRVWHRPIVRGSEDLMYTSDSAWSSVTDAGIENVRGMSTLRELDLTYARITDAALERLKDLKHLQWLCLYKTNVTDAGLENLRWFQNLEELYLTHTKITDAGLEHLTGMTKLRVLGLQGTNVTDRALEYLVTLRQLQKLSLGSTKITDAALDRLADLPDLRELDLSDTAISDTGLKQLKRLPMLRVLSLDHTRITNVGLKHLRELARLESLSIGENNIGDGVKELRQVLPNCAIVPEDKVAKPGVTIIEDVRAQE